MSPVCSVLVGVSDGDGWSVSPACPFWQGWAMTVPVIGHAEWYRRRVRCRAQSESDSGSCREWLLESELSVLEHVEVECTLDDHEIEELHCCHHGNRVGGVSECGLRS